MKKIFFIANFALGVMALQNVNCKVNDWVSTGPTVDDILAANAVENLAVKGSQEDKLITAVKKGDLKAVNNIIAGGVTLEARDKENMTPLMIAVKKGFCDIASKLIKTGADIHITGKYGETLLFLLQKATMLKQLKF